MKKTELQTMVVSELKALAKKMKVKMPSGARKAEIVELLSAAFQAKRATASRLIAKSNSGRQKNAIVKQSVPVTKKHCSEEERRSPKRQISVKTTPFRSRQWKCRRQEREWKMPPGTEEPLMAQERVSDAKYYTGPGRDSRQTSCL